MRVEYYNNILCIEAGWLIEADIISEANYKQLSARKNVSVVRRAARNTPALVTWESIPQRFKDVIIKEHGDPQKSTMLSVFMPFVRHERNLISIFANHMLPNGDSLPLERQKEYYANAILLNAIHLFLNNRKTMRKALQSATAKNVWNSISDTINEIDRKEYPHSLPSNERRLKDKYNLYIKEGAYSLIHKAYDNNNARKVNSMLERLILSIYCASNKPYSSWVHEDYLKFIAGMIEIVDMQTGEMFERANFWDEKKNTYIIISDSTCWNIINNPKNRAIVDSIRMNNHQYMSTVRPHNLRHGPIFGLSKISLDDRDLPRKMHDGSRVKAYYAYDVTSGCLIGSAYSIRKDKTLFIDCVRDMFYFIKDNNWGMPMEVEVEHHLVKEFKDDLMQAGVVFPFVHWCAPGNSQEKHAEQFNRQKKYGYEKRYQDGVGRFYLKDTANQTGGERVYDDELDKYVIKERTYSYEELVADDRETIEKYNNGLHRDQKKYRNKTRLQVLQENINPNLVEINEAVLARYIGACTKTSIVRNMYCQVQYEKYMLPSPEQLARLAPNNYSVQAYFLPANEIREVYVYQGDKFIGKCNRIERYNTSTAETTENDVELRKIQTSYIVDFDKMVKGSAKKLAKTKTYDIEQLQDCEIVEAEVFESVEIVENDPFEFDNTDEYLESFKQRAELEY